MANYLCGQCYLQGYCRELVSYGVRGSDLTSRFIRDVREYMRALGIPPARWEAYLTTAYRDYPGRILDQHNAEVYLDTALFDGPEIRTWFRDLCRPIPEGTEPRLRKEARSRFIVTATILRALDPVAASLWGKLIANDNGPLARITPRPGQRDCPYQHFSRSMPVKDDHSF